MSPACWPGVSGVARSALDLAESVRDRLEQGAAVGVFVQHVGAVAAGGLRRFDEQMGPAWVVRVGRQVEPVGQAGGAEGEVALRVGRDGVQHVPERRPRQRRRPSPDRVSRGPARRTNRRPARAGPVRSRRGRSRRGRASTIASQRCGDARAANPIARSPRLGRQFVQRLAASLVDGGERADQQRARPGSPRSARRIAGASTWASGRRPKRSCSAHHPSTQPGTVTVRMSCRNGIT